ncbi:hypothetical protein [Paraliobacillus sp. X-1268]|nr:hypothetical protein [Paraliobacillus sp. X-1268]
MRFGIKDVQKTVIISLGWLVTITIIVAIAFKNIEVSTYQLFYICLSME